MKFFLILGVLVCVARGDVLQILQEVTTPPPPPRPYAFGYAAGRFPGHIDRTHSEVSDGNTVQGSYSYVDPSHRIRTVDYVADKTGFRASVDPPEETRAVAEAKAAHAARFASIAAQHATGRVAVPRDSAAVEHAKRAHLDRYAAIAAAHQVSPGQVIVPVDSAAVQRATAKHYNLFQEIAAEHARIAAERAPLEHAEQTSI